MKRLISIVLGLGLLAGCSVLHRQQYQACSLSVATAHIWCGVPQDKAGADLKAMAVNVGAQGTAIAWTQKVQKDPQSVKAVNLQDLLKNSQVQQDDK
jgi:hypothetical protein